MHAEIETAVPIAAIDDVASILRDRGTHARLDQFLDLFDDVSVRGVLLDRRSILDQDASRCPLCEERRAADEMIQQSFEHQGFEVATPEQTREALQRQPGVGPWTVEYVALRGLGEPDAFPDGDLVLRRVAGGARPLTATALRTRAERWRPWRGYAALLLWSLA